MGYNSSGCHSATPDHLGRSICSHYWNEKLSALKWVLSDVKAEFSRSLQRPREVSAPSLNHSSDSPVPSNEKFKPHSWLKRFFLFIYGYREALLNFHFSPHIYICFVPTRFCAWRQETTGRNSVYKSTDELLLLLLLLKAAPSSLQTTYDENVSLSNQPL